MNHAPMINVQTSLVRKFHETFEHPVGENSSHVEPLEIRQLRIKLLFEELAELALASDCMKTFSDLAKANVDLLGLAQDGENVNKLEELDALCDLQYVLSGKILTSGLHQVFDENFLRVHTNNMSKAHYSRSHAEETLDRKLKGQGTIIERNGRFVVLNEDKKVIKPWDHEKVKLTL